MAYTKTDFRKRVDELEREAYDRNNKRICDGATVVCIGVMLVGLVALVAIVIRFAVMWP